MEDITKRQIACLVLGYLKKGNYKNAHKDFYKNCPYFSKFREKKHRFSTRMCGLTLEQILHQYDEICSIVQPRLEETDYYDSHSLHYQAPISEKLLYLLNHSKTRSARSTPLTSVCSPACSPDGQGENESHSFLSSMELSASLDLSTTPLSKLPGNSSEVVEEENGSFKKPGVYNDTTDEVDRDECSSEVENGITEAVEAFKESLLAREELQATIAHTINEVRCETIAGGEVEAAVKEIINRTEMVPAFEDLIDEILGVPETSETERVKRSTPKSTQSTQSLNTTQVQLETPPSTTSQNEAFDATTSAKNMIVIDSAGLVNSQTLSANANLLMPANSSANSFINTPGAVNLVGQPEGQQQYILSEADIMSMPVYVCGDKSAEKVLIDEGIQVPGKRLKTILPRKDKSTEKPKLTTGSLADFITMYSCNNDDALTCSEIVAPRNTNVDTTIAPPAPTQPFAITVLPVTTGETIVTTGIDITTPDGVVAVNKPPPIATPRSGGRSSHVRALDFQKFHTPRKEVLKVVQSSSTSPRTYTNKKKTSGAQKSSKTLFSAGKHIKEPWDSKFRASITANSTTQNEQLQKEEREGQARNSERMSTEKQQLVESPNENIDSTNNARETNQKKKNPPRKTKAKSQQNTIANIALVANETTPLANKAAKAKLVKLLPDDIRQNEIIVQNTFTLTKVNTQPTYRKKCNIDNMREVKVVIPKETKITELIAESAKVVLSPSKLNGSKRSLVDVEVSRLDMPSMVTPEANKTKMEPAVVPSSSRARNIIPILQTPGKCVDMCPKTPSIYNPGVEETPMTKMFNEHTTGVDIAGIPTPNVLLTPSFPLTPFMNANATPSYNPPTDYSTSSSYYQPSDTEQNKSIDKLIKECQRLESAGEESSPLFSGSVATSSCQQTAKSYEEEVAVEKAVVEKMKSMRSNVIAKKNLNLIKKKDSEKMSSSSDDASSCSSSSDSSSSSDDEEEDQANDTVMANSEKDQANDTVMETSSRYPLRSRSSPQVPTPSRGESPTKKSTPETTKKQETTTIDKEVGKSTTKLKEDVKSSPVLKDVKSRPVQKEDVKSRPVQKEDPKFRLVQREDIKSKPVQKEVVKSRPVQKENTKSRPNRKDIKSRLTPNIDVKSEIASKTIEDTTKKRETEKKQPMTTRTSDGKYKKDTGETKPVSNKDISDIVTSVAYIPALNRQAAPEDKQKQILTALEAKRKRMVDAFKGEHEVKPKKITVVRLPPKKRKPATPVRVLRSNNVKLKEDDLHLTSSDEDIAEPISIRPFEVVETELHCSNSNPLSEITLRVSDDEGSPLGQLSSKCTDDSGDDKKQTVDEKEISKELIATIRDNMKKCIANNPTILETEVEARRTPKKTDVKRKEMKTPQCTPSKTEKQVKTARKLVETKEIPLRKFTKKVITKISIKPVTKLEENKDKAVKTCDKVEKLTAKEENVSKETKESLQTLSRSSLEEPETKVVGETTDVRKTTKGKGTTEEEAKTELMIGMQKMGFPLIPVDQPEKSSEESNDDIDDASLTQVLRIDPPENIAHCYKFLNSLPDDLVEFDTKVFTEPISIDGTKSTLSSIMRDLEDDQMRLAKSYKLTIYNEEIDAEMVKEMRVTPYVDVFNFDPSQRRIERPRKDKVRVLHNVVIMKDNRSMTASKDDSEPIDRSALFVFEGAACDSETISETGRDRKRKLSLSTSEVSDACKKLKLDDQRLLQDMNVDDFLQKMHG